jgi:capsular polysaccharide biosynthesis protein
MYSNYHYVPIYQASTRLIVNQTVQNSSSGAEQIDFGAIGFNIELINTYKEIIKTPSIIEKVLQRHPDLNMSEGELIGAINVSDVNGTQLMAISARDTSYERAVKIANDVTEVFQTEIPKIMKVENIAILNVAKIQDNPQPVNKKSNQYVLIGFLGSFICAIVLVLFLESIDDTLKTEDELRHMFDTSILAIVPKMKEKELRRKTKGPFRGGPGEVTYAAGNR